MPQNADVEGFKGAVVFPITFTRTRSKLAGDGGPDYSAVGELFISGLMENYCMLTKASPLAAGPAILCRQ